MRIVTFDALPQVRPCVQIRGIFKVTMASKADSAGVATQHQPILQFVLPDQGTILNFVGTDGVRDAEI